MSRIIKFRGLRADNGDWVFGMLCYFVNMDGVKSLCIQSDIANPMGTYPLFDVNPATVGQFTGLTDSEGVEIYEGDIISINKNSAIGFNFNLGSVLRVGFFEGGFMGYTQDGLNVSCRPLNMLSDIKIIGNIHTNPELMEK